MPDLGEGAGMGAGGCFSTLAEPKCSGSGCASSLAQFLLQAPWRPLLGLRLALLTRAWAVREVISLQPAGFEYGNDL